MSQTTPPTIIEALIANLEAKIGISLKREGDRLYLAQPLGELVRDQFERELEGLDTMPAKKVTSKAPVKKPPKATSNSKPAPKSKTPTSPKMPPKIEKRPDMGIDERVAAMKAIFADNQPHAASEFRHLWTTDEDSRSGTPEGLHYYLNYRLFVDKIGKGAGMKYILYSAKAKPSAAKEPDPDLFDFKPPVDDDDAQGADEEE